MKKRYLVDNILRDLNEKMVFIGGARQVGKTSMAQYIAEKHYKSSDYLNWDVREDRRNIIQSSFKGDAKIILFDEIHKYKDWKNYLKGQFDKHRKEFKILVTGSARLDVYRRGGDSLMGRYFYCETPIPKAKRIGIGKLNNPAKRRVRFIPVILNSDIPSPTGFTSPKLPNETRLIRMAIFARALLSLSFSNHLITGMNFKGSLRRLYPPLCGIVRLTNFNAFYF